MAKRTKKKAQTQSNGYMLEVTEDSVNTSFNSYCQAYGITQDQLTLKELEWLCFVITAYSHTKITKDNRS